MLDQLNGITNIIENFKSVIWNVQYFGKNNFQIVAPVIDENMDLLVPGKYLVRAEDASSDGFKNVMIIENIQLDIDSENGWLITASGRGLKTLLERRIIWGQTNISGKAEVSIRNIITNNVINPVDNNRKINDFILGDLKNLSKELEVQLFGENIADWLEEVCTSLGYGWDIFIKNNKYVFQMYEGTDRSDGSNKVIFSPTFDNLLSSTYQNKKEFYQNAALIGGEGEGTSKRLATIGTASGLDRYEAYVDGSSVSSNGEIITEETYIELLKGYGQTQLSQKQITTSFEGDVEPNGIYKLNEDYFLGDLVKVENEIGISATTRINEIIYSEDENGSSVIPTFSEWEVDN